MICEKIDLYGDHRVMLYTYIQRWTTVPGHYPSRAGVVVLPGGGLYVPRNQRRGAGGGCLCRGRL